MTNLRQTNIARILMATGLGICAIFLFFREARPSPGAAFAAPANQNVGWQLVNGDGFGNNCNSSLPALEEFQGFLYAGTNNTLETELWRSTDGLNWTGVLTNDGIHTHTPYIGAMTVDLAVFDGYLYASTLYRGQGGALWRTLDGLSWTPVITRTPGLYQVYSPMQVYSGSLYLIANTAGLTQTSEIWQNQDGLAWQVSSPDDFDAYTLAVFDGRLYAGGKDRPAGSSALWYSERSTWTQALHDMGAPFTSTIISLVEYQGELYAARLNQGYSKPYLDLWHSPDGEHWTAIAAATQAINAQAGTLLSSTALFALDGKLFLFTYDLNAGGDVWRTRNGTDWEQVGFDGWGDAHTHGANGRNSIADFHGHLLVGASANLGSGSQLWLYLPEILYLPVVSKN